MVPMLVAPCVTARCRRRATNRPHVFSLPLYDSRAMATFFVRNSQTARGAGSTFSSCIEVQGILHGLVPSRSIAGEGTCCPYRWRPKRSVRQGTVMSQSDQPPGLYVTRIDIPLEVRTYLITLLNQTLASTVDLRSHVKQALWNVKGKDFAQLQVLFATMATELDAYTDLVAELYRHTRWGGAGHSAHGRHPVDTAGISRRPHGGQRPCPGPGGAFCTLRSDGTGQHYVHRGC